MESAISCLDTMSCHGQMIAKVRSFAYMKGSSTFLDLSLAVTPFACHTKCMSLQNKPQSDASKQRYLKHRCNQRNLLLSPIPWMPSNLRGPHLLH